MHPKESQKKKWNKLTQDAAHKSQKKRRGSRKKRGGERGEGGEGGRERERERGEGERCI
jgi:hypothetical protein